MDAIEIAERLNLADLAHAKIDPKSPAGREFLFRARVFGASNVQPPRPELNDPERSLSSQSVITSMTLIRGC